MNTESPFEGDPPGGGDEPSYKWLDEWLCEYVDGEMDPSLETVFEQYLQANPELKAHVERLEETRELLCNCGLPNEARPEVEPGVTRDVEEDVLASSPSPSERAWNGPLTAVGLASWVAAALVVGFLVGAMVVNPAVPVASLGTHSVDRGITGADGDPSSGSPAQTMRIESGESFLRRSGGSMLAPDSSGAPWTITRIGVP